MFGLLKRAIDTFSQSHIRIFRFALNSSLRPYLKEEIADLDFQLKGGRVNIPDLDLNEAVTK